jgi:hypothetical protein
MTERQSISRRAFLAGTTPRHLYAQNRKRIPVGLLIYAVLADWKRISTGPEGRLQMGYEGLELTQYELESGPRPQVRVWTLQLKVFSAYRTRVLCSRDKMKAAIS